MRIIGGEDYYDGIAVVSSDPILRFIVLRRDEGRTLPASQMAGRGMMVDVPDVLLHPLGGSPTASATMIHAASRLIGRKGPFAFYRSGDVEVSLSCGAAAFCGTMRRCILVTAGFEGRHGRRTSVKDWCWSETDLQEALASHGVGMRSHGLAAWFEPVDVRHQSKKHGFCMASLNPEADPDNWSLDAPTLDDMNHQHVVAPDDALAGIARWLGGEGGRMIARSRGHSPIRQEKVATLVG